jgi:hypothetical protein
MTVRCLLCDQRDAGHRYACDHCVTGLQRQLREIETYAAVLPILAQPGRSGMPSRGAPGYGSRSPANDDVIVAMDARSKGDPLGPDDTTSPIISIPAGVHYIANGVRHEQGWVTPLRWTITSEVAFLLGRVPHAAMHQWVTTFATMVGKLHRQARALAHDQPPRPLGVCLGVDCDGQVYPRHDGARCNTCLRVYTGLDLARLGAAQEATG